MKKKKTKVPDRRIQRTKSQLSDALIALILEKGYDKVTIRDIIDKANVGRSTFYAHFESKDQLLVAGHEHFNKILFTGADTSQTSSKKISLGLLSLYRHTGENHSLAKALFGKKGGDIIINHLRGIIAHKIKKCYSSKISKGKEEQLMFTFITEASSFAVVSLLVSWLENDMPVPAEKMAAKSDEIVNAVIKSIL
jgi:AcrR family transcriptional regulator